jgi:hypothetical protein
MARSSPRRREVKGLGQHRPNGGVMRTISFEHDKIYVPVTALMVANVLGHSPKPRRVVRSTLIGRHPVNSLLLISMIMHLSAVGRCECEEEGNDEGDIGRYQRGLAPDRGLSLSVRMSGRAALLATRERDGPQTELGSPVLNTSGRPSRIFLARHRSIARRDRPQGGHTRPFSDATCSSASSKSRSVKAVRRPIIR